MQFCNIFNCIYVHIRANLYKIYSRLIILHLQLIYSQKSYYSVINICSQEQLLSNTAPKPCLNLILSTKHFAYE